MKKIFECEECGMVFSYVSLYNRHKLVHSTDRQFKCAFCPKRFKRSDTLRTHENIHTGNSKLMCCGKAHNSKAALKYHQRLAHTSSSTATSVDCKKQPQERKLTAITDAPEGQLTTKVIENYDLVVFAEDAMSEDVEQHDMIRNISTPMRQNNSMVAFDSMKLSLFK